MRDYCFAHSAPPPNHALQRTRRKRPGCKLGVPGGRVAELGSLGIMKRLVILACLVVPLIGCERRASQSELTASMSDDSILRVIGLDLAALHSERVQGKDGYSIVYTNDRNRVVITRSIVSGVRVVQLRPTEQKREWNLGKP